MTNIKKRLQTECSQVAILAQLVEQLICNQQVVSSNLTDGSKKREAFASLFLLLRISVGIQSYFAPTFEINPPTPTRRQAQRNPTRRTY